MGGWRRRKSRAQSRKWNRRTERDASVGGEGSRARTGARRWLCNLQVEGSISKLLIRLEHSETRSRQVQHHRCKEEGGPRTTPWLQCRRGQEGLQTWRLGGTGGWRPKDSSYPVEKLEARNEMQCNGLEGVLRNRAEPSRITNEAEKREPREK